MIQYVQEQFYWDERKADYFCEVHPETGTNNITMGKCLNDWGSTGFKLISLFPINLSTDLKRATTLLAVLVKEK